MEKWHCLQTITLHCQKIFGCISSNKFFSFRGHKAFGKDVSLLRDFFPAAKRFIPCHPAENSNIVSLKEVGGIWKEGNKCYYPCITCRTWSLRWELKLSTIIAFFPVCFLNMGSRVNSNHSWKITRPNLSLFDDYWVLDISFKLKPIRLLYMWHTVGPKYHLHSYMPLWRYTLWLHILTYHGS